MNSDDILPSNQSVRRDCISIICSLNDDLYKTSDSSLSNFLGFYWNGKTIANVKRAAPGILEFTIGRPSPRITVSDLARATWRVADGLPEIQRGYDDSRKYYGVHYLYACEYGFCEGSVLWRGHFDSTGHETAVNLSITGGRAFAGSVWLNDVFIGAAYGNSSNNDVALCGQMMHWVTQFS
ncbi:galactose-binding domain-like protein [Mycena pura]|uniref:Galactose-binding domain-like protein n=1 Tax=Mycena pura TaxID=153505 RepID=A0AAD6VGB0_9AGAR|nr:galactose-binding domain-like protein [Mycena pura]